MTWSHVAVSSGSSSATSFTPTWPAGLQDGDVVVWGCCTAPDSSLTCTTPGWRITVAGGARFMWARYSAAQPLPTIGNASGATVTWRMAAWRSTVGSAFGADLHQDGSPPAASSITTTTPNTLLLLFAAVVGDQSTWTESSDFTAVVNLNGSGTGNPNAPNLWLGWRVISTPAAITGIRTYMAVSRYMLLAVGEPQFQGGFFHE